MNINVQQAVSKAQNYFQSLQTMLLMGNGVVQDVRLEEVELSEDQKFWFITLGYNRPVNKSQQSPLAEIMPDSTKYEREYKVFKIDSETGDVQSMKIREL